MSTAISEDNDHMIVKGKRTKRLRPSSSTADFYSASLVSSPTTSTSTEEDEDLANCLILLARGGIGIGSQSQRIHSKFTSRKFTEMAATADGKVGIYVYECKTCSRTFPSFQALGGHRASHKKPKSAADFDQKKLLPPPPDNQEKEEEKEVDESKLITVAPPPSTRPKIHDCSICGAEFASGQALGGHMRRHRSGQAPAARIGGDSLINDDHHVVEKARNMLALDLNLPALPDDDHREVEFRGFSSNQQSSLVFSAAALVDCHY